MARVLAFVALAAAAITTASADITPTNAPVTVAPGDYRDVSIDANLTSVLTATLANDSKYAPEVKTRLCYSDILRVEQRVVAGFVTRYHVTGCEVSIGTAGGGKCSSSANCARSGYAVTIFTRVVDSFEQIWTIEKEAIATPNPTPRPSCAS